MPRLATLTVFAIVIAVIVPATTVADNTTIPLSWRDSGYDLAAGYRYTFSLSTDALPVTHASPTAALSAGPLDIELTWPWNPHLKISVNGQAVFDQDLSDPSVTIYVTISCDGSGTIEVSGYGNVGGFSIDHSYRIMVSTDTISNPILGSVSSHVTISRQALNCQISNPSLTPISENPAQQIQYNPLLVSIQNALTNGVVVFVLIVAIGIAVLILLIALGKAGGASKIVRKAIG